MTETCLPIVQWLKNWFTSTDDLLDKTYPVGSIYMSVNNTSPQTLFGGTWVQLTDTFLYATSTTADANSTTATDGSKDAVIVSHTHGTYSKRANITYNSSGNTNILCHATNTNATSNGENGNFVASKGESGTDKNMPPYMKVYMWKRTS